MAKTSKARAKWSPARRRPANMAVAKGAVVTGGAHGIGRAIAETLAARGYTVTVIDRKPPEGPWPASTPAGAVTFAKADVASEPQLRRAIVAAIQRQGRLDALVNNAGIMIRKPFRTLTLAEWNRVLATNLTAAFVGARAAADALRESRGAIVNIASTRALMSEPDTEAYAATKGGLVALTHALAISLGPAVRVNCISPGWIDVQGGNLSRQDHAQHPAGRVGQPQDIAELTGYLLSDVAGFVTGANFTVDGGMTRKMIYAE
jgi:NAD(P)-dependent dehydrogenase (short-subunit alcohol dehydrogenase family)